MDIYSYHEREIVVKERLSFSSTLLGILTPSEEG
jgi:hypothetical protein